MISLTPEQMEAVMCDDPLILVRAFAGTGKTLTLLEHLAYHEEESALCLAFNRSAAAVMARRAEDMGIYNAVFGTMHSFAYRRMSRIARLRGRVKSGLSAFELAQSFGKDLAPDSDAPAAALLLSDLFTSWNRSDTDKPEDFLEKIPARLSLRASLAGLSMERIQNCFLRMAESLIKAPADFPWMTHDAYMKLCALRDVKGDDFDLIIVDEAQDAQRVLLGLLAKMPGRKMLVGDPCQQIYGWNGCVDAFGAACGSGNIFDVEPTNLTLTRSFRCPSGIATTARPWLHILGTDEPFLPRDEDIPMDGHAAFIARTNAALLWHMDALRRKGIPQQDICLMGASPSSFESVFDIAMLSQRRFRDIRSPELARFASLKDFAGFAKEIQDTASLAAVDLVSRRGSEEVLAMRAFLRGAFAESPQEAKVTLSTVHRAKGSEFDVVALGPDFFNAPRTAQRESAAAEERKLNGMPAPRRYNIEEFRLLYVAMTRAKFELTAPDGVTDDPSEKLDCIIKSGGRFTDGDADVTEHLKERLFS